MESKVIVFCNVQHSLRESMASPALASPNTTATATDPDVEGMRMIWVLIWYLAVLPAWWIAPVIFSCCCRRVYFRGAATECSPAAAVANAEASTTAAQLEAAEQARKRLQRRVNGAFWQVGWMLGAIGLINLLAVTVVRRGAPEYIDPTPIVGGYMVYGAILPWGMGMLLLSVQASEAARIRTTIIWTSVLSLAGALLTFGSVFTFYNAGYTEYAIVCLAIAVGTFAFVVAGAHSLHRQHSFCGEPVPPRRQLARLWVGFRAVMFLYGTVHTCTGTFRFLCSDSECVLPPGENLAAGISFLLVALVFTRANRGRITRRLGLLGKSGPAEQQAASVASLLGDTSVFKALADAIKCFRAQPVSKITRAALVNNEPDPSLHALTVPATLGAVDAFMSHSWSDDGSLKYDKLLEWAHELGGDGDKLVWLDKSCIDQLNIDANLSCLPVFLSGCQQLLMLVDAPSSPIFADVTRLWCVMEVFAFFRIKNIDSTANSAKFAGQLLAIKLLDKSADVTRSLSCFDAAKAHCRYDRDRQKLLAVIEASFGTTMPFNQLVVKVLSAQMVGLKEASRHTRASRRQGKADINVALMQV